MSSEPSVGYLIYGAGRLLKRLADQRLEPLGLSSAYLPIISELAKHGEMSQKRLAELVRIEQPTMTATLSRMERDRVIERRRNPQDGRSALISLAARTNEQLPAIQAVARTISEDALAELPEHQRAEFRQVMSTIISTLVKLVRDPDEQR